MHIDTSPSPANSNGATSCPLDAFGCAGDKLADDQELVGSDVRFHRKRTAGEGASQVVMPAAPRGFLVGVSLREGHRRRIFDGRRGRTHEFAAGSVYVRSLGEDYKADFDNGFDFILIELPRPFIERTGTELGQASLHGLRAVAGEPDPVLAHLARALVPALQQPSHAQRLFIDQLGLAVGTHLLGRYGEAGAAAAAAARRLAPRCLAKAKEMLAANIAGDLSVADVADACGLSRSHFTRAFHASTGQTPHQWLMAQRLEHACALLRDSRLPLAQVAVACGFADQSHFTRVFSRTVGAAPGNWRRQVCA
ncbi:AraC family transcriptional regulator [Cupriavidus sp. USMAA2-4]|uniref:AraC family transcriptional regulator n=1 Tax=Cupriavidus malaysiensis TaxID=367825 RepID=A0ABM6F421_9BURK|nr:MULTISPECIES: AraC family transcriptional regulator [Cupriavidus]AOY91005.1 AraC family transcriptional regulator [Cupriavidus sp. USMAA2-4]AOY99422.1 AraC family transcriptional regulator [Cupriavidus sp. USMAHM13]AOZ06039.1 AraC family transcriptional regulator [Cupriavidus malaysiensis]